MTKDEFALLCKSKVIILDGATGTQLQKRGMPTKVCPEKWVVENCDVLVDIQKKYIEAGSDIIYTCSFGGNFFKLFEFGLDTDVFSINKSLAQLSKKAVAESGKVAFVAGGLAPTGKLISPLGDVEFEDVVRGYKTQVEGLLDGGVDLFVIETMINIQEARAAVIAIRELCHLPIMLTVTFEPSGKTLTGTDPASALVTMQSMGIDAFGVNCSTGPDKICDFISMMQPYAKIPLIAKPNAGLPTLVDGKTVFSMDCSEFSSYTKKLVDSGANIIGGCCGTDFQYIQSIENISRQLMPIEINKCAGDGILSSVSSMLDINNCNKTLIIGERINPTGKKKFQQSIINKDYESVVSIARAEVEDGADILDVNVGMPNIDEVVVLKDVIKSLTHNVDLPLCIDSSNPRAIEAALRIYPGRALVNSISLEEVKLKEILPIVSFYGSMVIALPLGDGGLPKNLDERISNIKSLLDVALEAGVKNEDIIVDGLVMTISSSQASAKDTLNTIKWCSDHNIKTVIGLSNISFGLPHRVIINSTFMAIAAYNGLTMAIANPKDDKVLEMRDGADVINGKDASGLNFIDCYGNREIISANTVNKPTLTPSKTFKARISELNANGNCLDKAYVAIINGDKKNIINILQNCLDEGYQAKLIIEDYLIKAITEVGDLFESQIYFLPQLILSAQAMENGFAFLKPFLVETSVEKANKITVVLATVKGDIHDIGKNIVALMFRNNGFDVYDLGNDVSCEKILESVDTYKPNILGLSALMTTTMTEMKEVIIQLKKVNTNCKVIIGGAVITPEYASSIGADGYSDDASSAVKLVKNLLSI